MKSSPFSPGDSVLCPRGLGEAVVLEVGAQLDLREPYEPTLCKVRLKRAGSSRVRYFHTHELARVGASNVRDESTDER